MRSFSASIGILWADLPPPAAIRAAGAAGFAAVECHWPYATPPAEVAAALAETGLPMICLNTRPGGPGEFGLSALKGRKAEARAAIDEALAYAAAVGASAVHVMAGINGDEAAYRAALAHACDHAPPGLTILIEPLNPFDVPGYFLTDFTHAAAVLDALARPNLKLMFDCYHAGRNGLDIAATFAAHRPRIGHVQIAAVPDRGPPDHGTVDYATLLPLLDWPSPIGAEYRSKGPADASLGWLAPLSSC